MAGQELVIVFDESISYRIGNAFAAFCVDYPGLTIKYMKPGTKDRDWLDGEFPIDPPHIVIARDSVLRPTGQLRAWVRGRCDNRRSTGQYRNPASRRALVSLVADDPGNRARKPKAGGFRGPGQIREQTPVTEMEFERQTPSGGQQETRNQEAKGSAGKTEGRSTG
jgi:hypothetical protein